LQEITTPANVALALQTAQTEAIVSGQSPFYWAGYKYIAG
jgi:CHAT domain-containing protein